MCEAQFTGQQALITGGGSGIGRSLAISLAAAGAEIILVGRTVAKLKAVAAEVRACGSQCCCLPADLADTQDVHQLGNTVKTQFDRLNIVIHCAALFRPGPLLAATAADCDALFATNVRSTILLTQELVPLLTDAGGQVVFINSMAALHPTVKWGLYATSKAALAMVADCLRLELAPLGIRVISIFPGRTATPMQAQVAACEGKPYQSSQFAQPEDVAEITMRAMALPRRAEVTDVHLH